MKRLLLTISIVAVFCLISQFAAAGGCKIEEVDRTKYLASMRLRDLAREKILEIEKAQNLRGEQMEVVLVARVSDSLGKFKIIKDDPTTPLEAYLTERADEVENLRSLLRGEDMPFKRDRVEAVLAAREKLNGQTNIGDAEIIAALDLIENPNDVNARSGYAQLGYSHLGFVVKNASRKWDPKLKLPDEKRLPWDFAYHLLAECDEDSMVYKHSKIFGEAFHQFFWDSKLHKKGNNKTLVIVPSPALQSRIMDIIKNAELRNSFHEPKYNVASVPFTFEKRKDRVKRLDRIAKGKTFKSPPQIYQLEDQNSNQLPLEWIAAASQPEGKVKNRADAQDTLLKTNYRPHFLIPGGLQGALAKPALDLAPFLSLFSDGFDLRHIMNLKRQSYMDQGILQLMTVAATVEYLRRNNWLATNFENPQFPGTYEVVISRSDLKALEEQGEREQKVIDMCEAKLINYELLTEKEKIQLPSECAEQQQMLDRHLNILSFCVELQESRRNLDPDILAPLPADCDSAFELQKKRSKEQRAKRKG